MRMRTALVAWARRQPQEAPSATEPGILKCTFNMDARSPDDLPFKHKIFIRLKGPGAERMLGMVGGLISNSLCRTILCLGMDAG